MTLPGNQNNQPKPSQVFNGTASLEVKSPSPNVSPEASPRPQSRLSHKRDNSSSSSSSPKDVPLLVEPAPSPDLPPASLSPDITSTKSELSSGSSGEPNRGSSELVRSNSQEPIRNNSSKQGSDKSESRSKKKTPWYSALYPYPTYKSRCEDFKRIFKDVPAEERLVVDYSCAIQRDILVHGRLYVSQNYLCFYANIFRWETLVVLPWKEVTALTKEKTALVIPNALLVHTNSEKHFFTSFGARDKAYVMLFRVWQSALIDQPVGTVELLQWVRSCYGDDLGLSSEEDEGNNSSCQIEDLDCKLPKESYSEESLSISMGEISCGGDIGSSASMGALSTDQPMQNGSPQPQQQPNHSRNNSPSGGNVSPNITPTTIQLNGLPQPQSVGDSLSGGNLSPALPSPGIDIRESDLSDESSASESGSEKQGNIVTCPVDHEGRLILHMQVSIHVDQLFAHLFTNSKFFTDLHENRKSTDVKQSTWVHNTSTNQKDRTVSLTVMLAQAVGPKQAQVTETQRMLECSKPGEMYAIDVEASNAGVPYAESFFISTHYCLTRGDDPNTSTIAVYCQIKYRKSVWGIVKSFIEKNCWSGLEDYYSSLVKALEAECERTRRAMLAGVSKRKIRRRPPRRLSCSAPDTPPEPPVFPLQRLPLTQPLPHMYTRGSGTGGPIIAPVQHMSQSRQDLLTWLTFFVLLILLVINAALYYKLWGLEQQTASHRPPPFDFSIIRDNPTSKSPDEWKTLLLQQEKLHSAEVERWLRILKAAVHLLQQVEHSLTALQATIQSMVTENMYMAFKDPASTLPPNEEL